jgi:hypothetical protein
MQQTAEVVPLELPVNTPAPRPIRALPIDAVDDSPDEVLIRRLAADRLRDLADDGVTLSYIARMYDVEPGQMERLQGDLLPVRR